VLTYNEKEKFGDQEAKNRLNENRSQR